MERIGILVVHGVGEQTRFEHLEAIGSNLYRALSKAQSRQAYLQIRQGDQVPRHSPEDSWREAPALVRWRKVNGDWVEALFREVYWADLDIPLSWRGWLKLVGWALGISGVRLFDLSKVGPPDEHGMCPPKGLSFWNRFKVRLELFIVSLLFFLVLVTVDLLYGLLTRLSYRAQWLKKIRGLIYNYLGDVKLYQDLFLRDDDRLETIGEKSRVAIRRRMVRTLVRTAVEVEAGKLQGYYIFAHSLGTVVAFNALMETGIALPNYLTEEEWMALPNNFKQQAPQNAPQVQMPRRPPWLGPRDAINRARLFAGLRGFLTMGSPLDKFAALWPAIVPINGEAIPNNVSWINVADVQDIVAGSIDLFPPCRQAPGVGGLQLLNVQWADQASLFSAHTSYWITGKSNDRLIDHVIPWLEGSQLVRPVNSIRPWRARLTYWLSFPVLGVFLLLVAASLAWLLKLAGMILQVLARASLDGQSMNEWLARLWDVLSRGGYLAGLARWSPLLLGIGLLTVLICSLSRRIWEEYR